MTDKINDGGPAFPHDISSINAPPAHFEGMSLRDWFAGQALAGELASQSEDRGEYGESADSASFTVLSYRCYKAADAMLSEREGARDD